MGNDFPSLPISFSRMQLPGHIDYAYAQLADLDIQAGKGLLSEQERVYLEAVRHEGRRQEYTAGRVLARRLAATHLDCNPEAVPLVVADDGSLLLEHSNFSISLAHSAGGVCAAVAQHTDVGIDLEVIRPRHPDLYRFILHPEEYDLLDTTGLDRDNLLILCWSIKEAVLKGMKTGFRCSPKKLRLDIDVEQGKAGIVIAGQDPWQCVFEQRDNNYLAIAYPGSVQRSTFNAKYTTKD